jgi:(5-formylfuran-3-yl)methyl phosphate synthase
LQLLVSVRSADEVGPALAGGSDIIDAKDPERGSLGAVDRKVLGDILQRVPKHLSVSVALGDVGSRAEVLAALNGLVLPARMSPTYLKLGFAGVQSPSEIQGLIQFAVAGVSAMKATPRIVAVAYADPERARTVRPELIPPLAKVGGAAGVLLDTYEKDGIGLLEWLSPVALLDWVTGARRADLVSALAGSLRPGDLARVSQADPDVVGFRGAACSGGRRGRVSEDRVRGLRLALAWAVRETRDTGAISSVPTAAKSRKLKA